MLLIGSRASKYRQLQYLLEKNRALINMQRKQFSKNIKEAECSNETNDHHFTKSFEIDRACSSAVESLAIKLQIEESQKRLTQLINDKNDKLIEIIEALTKKVERLTALPQSQISIRQENVSATEACEFQTLYQSTQDSYNANPSEIMPLPSIADVEFQQFTSKKHIEEQYSLLGQPQQILNRLKNRFVKMDLRFTQCQKIYDFPNMNGIDFHSVIDNKNNLLFLAELENNEIIGGFTHRCFDPIPNYIPKENKKSFLCNLNRDIFAFASRANKTLTYDENYFILGNWEIKVKNGENHLQTTWGSKSDCFQYTTFGGLEKHKIKQAEFFGQGSGGKCLKMNRYAFYAFS